MPMPRLRRGARPRVPDDDDWGTSSPAAIMETPDSAPPPVPPLHSMGHDATPPALRPTADASLSVAFARMKQQELKSYTCTFSSRCVISLYFGIALTFLPIGASIVASTAALGASERYKYSNIDLCSLDKGTCYVKFNITQKLRAPSYLYYTISNFHQNSRDYVKSRSDVMNRGLVPKAPLDVENCNQWLCPADQENCTRGADGSFSADNLIYPCGLTARSFFNDTLQICRDKECTGQSKVKQEKEGIAWWTDSKYKFSAGSDPVFEQSSKYNVANKTANQLLQDEDFVVWMRLSAFSTFDKLYRIIREDLDVGEYVMKIESRYPVEQFRGTKGFYITNTTWFGAGNIFLGTAYLIVGMTSLFIAITFLCKHVLHPASPSNIDPAILLREHLEKLNIGTADPLHQH